jgi:hypothetical protein
MAGLPADLNRRLRDVLLRCGPFGSNSNLRSVFVDARIHPWRERVPEAANRGARVDELIDALLDQADARDTPALALFTQVLAGLVSPDDACYQQLVHLAAELRGGAPRAVTHEDHEYVRENTWSCPKSSSGAAYVGSDPSQVFHTLQCSSVRRISPENRVCYGTRVAVLLRGKRPCLRCNP